MPTATIWYKNCEVNQAGNNQILLKFAELISSVTALVSVP